MATSRNPEDSERRRASVLQYTLRAALAYHIPLLAAYLALFLGLARFGYGDMLAIHVVILANSTFFIGFLKVKQEITQRDVSIQLFIQIGAWLGIVTAWFLVMDDLRILLLFASVLALFFVFVQTDFVVSLAATTVVAVDYVLVSYVGIHHLGQAGDLGRELLAALVFLPVSAFVAYLANGRRLQHREIRQAAQKRLEVRRHGERVQAAL
ncbi:MAG: hypothetical protein AAGE01_00405 [Pseudomonadota bacterium]